MINFEEKSGLEIIKNDNSTFVCVEYNKWYCVCDKTKKKTF